MDFNDGFKKTARLSSNSNEMAAVQSSQLESLEVRESGRSLKVQTDNPHLVSIGSGRLSTNVTWHPLPEGKVILGTSSDADIVLQGTGVEPKHCIIENVSNVVTLYPIAEMTTVDGHQITGPVRLCQGNMLCIGRSNYLRFNHPAEANLMKKFLPNTRISMAAPLNFFGNGDGFFEKKPPMPPSRRSQDSWEEVENSGTDNQQCSNNKFSKFDYFSQGQSKNVNCISPKVFPPGSATVNSPASVVLGHSRIPNGLYTASEKKSKIASSVSESECIDYIDPPVPQTISSFPQKVTVSSFNQQTYQNGMEHSDSDSDSNKIHSSRIFTLPSPAFNRNPSPYIPDRFRSVTPNALGNQPYSKGENYRSVTPSPGMNKSFKESNGLMTRSYDARLSPDFLFGDTEARESKEEQLESKMIQAQNERKLEQKAQMLEKQRLDEILNMCAEYERQVQNERQTQIPTTPTLHQNRIKTNGSLPRDKRNNGLPSPLAHNSDDELNQIFTFDANKSPAKTINCVYDNVRVVNNTLQVEAPEPIKRPNENLSKSVDSPDHFDINSVVNRQINAENTFVISPDINEKIVPSQSPRTRIKTTFREQTSKESVDVSKQLPGFADYDMADPIKYRERSPNSQKRKFLTPSQQLNKFNNLNSLMCANKEIDDDQKFILPVEEPKDLTDLMMILEKEFSATLSEFRDSDKSNTSSIEVRKEDSWINDELNNDLPESERDMMRPKKEGETLESNKKESFLRKKNLDDRGKMKVEKTAWLGVITRLKSEIQNLDQQEEEILREIKMELALLNAEHLSQKEKQKSDDDKLKSLREKKKQLDIDIEQCKERDADIQKKCNDRIQDLKKELQEMEESLGEKKEFSEEYKNLVDKLEVEKKSFEDVEFKHLEEEANWLATKDELQRDINEITGRLEDRKTKLVELESQIQEIEMSSQKETNILEQQKVSLMQQLDDAKRKIKELDVRLSAESEQDNFSEGEEGSGSLQKSKRSQEDLVRISKVTSDAPIDVGKTGSLGRKTLESLKEIERNRQIHLAKQGSQVIEEERKRVELLKRRVQDEVKAQWERTRQRECNSLNSVGSEDSNVTGSDLPTESASSEDVDKTLPTAILPVSSRDSADSDEKMRKESDGSDFRNSRPISDYSGSEFEHQVNVKRRDQKPMRLLQQRPLTRYLPIKSESLNLRQHIESAGHQVDLCPHVSIDATSCRGLLHKLGGKFHHWNKRWFVFDRMRRTLSYYSDKTEKKQRGGTYFQAIAEVYVDHLNSVKSPNPHVTFVIKTHERNYYLMAPSPEAMRIWVDVIFTGAEGYQEFEHGS